MRKPSPESPAVVVVTRSFLRFQLCVGSALFDRSSGWTRVMARDRHLPHLSGMVEEEGLGWSGLRIGC